MSILIIVVLDSISTDGRYIGFILILWALPASTLTLIMIPKVIAHRHAVKGTAQSSRLRGTHRGTVVSGMAPTTTSTSNTTTAAGATSVSLPSERPEGDTTGFSYSSEPATKSDYQTQEVTRQTDSSAPSQLNKKKKVTILSEEPDTAKCDGDDDDSVRHRSSI